MAVENVKSTTLTALKQESDSKALAPAQMGFMTTDSFLLAQRVGQMFASSSLVPKNYQNNLADCIIALNMANRIGADPRMVMQNLYIVHGRPSWSSQFLIATFNKSGRFSALGYEFFGEEGTDQWGCRAYAEEKSTKKILYGSKITIDIAKKEGWYAKSGSKWQSIPQQMLMYRAASWFIRAYAPELAMGLHTVEESSDIGKKDPMEYVTTLEELRTEPEEEGLTLEVPAVEVQPVEV